MSAPLRILHLADSHIGAHLPRRPRLERPRRGDDLITAYRTVLGRARELAVDLIIHAGDLFDEPNPSGHALTAAAAPLLELAADGFPIVVVPGNHERSVLPATVLLAHPRIHIAAQPTTVRFRLRGCTIAVAAVPCIRRGSGAAFERHLAATGWADEPADLHILAAHQAFDCARCNSSTYCFRTGEDVIARDGLPSAFAYIACGHIHQHQVLTTSAGIPLVYAGSCERVSFAEREEPKGCVLVEFHGGGAEHHFLEHPVRPMCVVPIDISGLTRRELRDALVEAVAGLPPRAVAALRLTGAASAGALENLGIAETLRQQRPEALITVTTRDVQFTAGPGAAVVPRVEAGAFAFLDDCAMPRASVTRDALSTLPATRGVYALYDSGGRLLYIGKAANVRARVRAHLRARSATAHFAGWAQRIARAETIPAISDLEALLIEAEAIRRARPPFNRRMRSWRSYCYIVASGQPFEHFAVTAQRRGAGCFGPYRSRYAAGALIEALSAYFGLAQCPEDLKAPNHLPLQHPADVQLCTRYYTGLCSGPCAGKVSAAEYAERMRRAKALLAGEDESEVVALERRLADVPTEQAQDERSAQLRRQADALRAAFVHGTLLRDAESLRGRALLIDAGASEKRVIQFTSTRCVFFRLASDANRRAAQLVACRARAQREARQAGKRLHQCVLDAFITAVHGLRACVEVPTFIDSAPAGTRQRESPAPPRMDPLRQ